MKTRKYTALFRAQVKARENKSVCACGRVADTVDHIIPQALLITLLQDKETAYEDEENLQLLCQLCNVSKAGRLDYRNPKTLPLMQKYFRVFEEKMK